MMRLLRRAEAFFFERISASGFGLLRVAWGLTALLSMLVRWPDVMRYFSDSGIIPPEHFDVVFRSVWRFSVLDTFGAPEQVMVIYVILLIALVFTVLGIAPRISTIISALLLFSFHERNVLLLGGGDTVLRAVGFILMIAPELRAFSLPRLRSQWHHWKEHGTLLAPLRMSIWPYRLLLWQLIVIYGVTLIDKLRGTMWLDGTAVAAVLHHPHFARWPMPFMDMIGLASPLLSYAVLLFLFSWFFLLIPRSVSPFLPRFKRFLLITGVIIHGGIFVLLDVGTFSIAMLMAYVGLLLDDDFAAMKNWLNRKWQGKIAVLYDGKCGMCQQSIFGLSVCDHLQRLEFVNYHDEEARKKVAPELKFEDLDRAMHIKTPTGKVENGYDAFRHLNWHLPPVWIFVPLFYLPGITQIGRRIYAHIADRRKKCTHEKCLI